MSSPYQDTGAEDRITALLKERYSTYAVQSGVLCGHG